jgi:hypothetical protein
MALRDLARAWFARLAHALALAGLREPGGAPVPPPPATGGAPVAEPWPEPPPMRRERPEPILDGKAEDAGDGTGPAAGWGGTTHRNRTGIAPESDRNRTGTRAGARAHHTDPEAETGGRGKD